MECASSGMNGTGWKVIWKGEVCRQLNGWMGMEKEGRREEWVRVMRRMIKAECKWIFIQRNQEENNN